MQRAGQIFVVGPMRSEPSSNLFCDFSIGIYQTFNTSGQLGPIEVNF
jgi:hypothetical protein